MVGFDLHQAGTTAKPQCAFGPPGQPPSLCALICKGNDPISQTTKLDDLKCPAKASCKPISSTAICTYDQKPGPPGPPSPPPAPGTDYTDPSDGGCKGDNKETTITGLQGKFCSPPCSASLPCPTDVPPGTTATGQCVLKQPTSPSPDQCALICKGNSFFTQQTLLDNLKCPAKASCKPIQTTAVCTYDS